MEQPEKKQDGRRNNGAKPGETRRKPQNPEQGRKVKVAITLTKQHAAWTKGKNRSRMIERGLDLLKASGEFPTM